MKKFLVTLIIAFMLIFTGINSNAGEPQPQKNLVMFNPVSILFGVISLEYERALAERISLSILGAFVTLSSEGTSVTGIGGGIAPRFFIAKKALNGLFISPGIELVSITGKNDDTDESSSAFGFIIPVILGYTWIWGQEAGFALSLGAGAAYWNLSVLDLDVTGVTPSLRLALGIGF